MKKTIGLLFLAIVLSLVCFTISSYQPAYADGNLVANAGGPYTIDLGSSVTLDGSGSNDIGYSIVSYSWFLSGGTAPDIVKNYPIWKVSAADLTSMGLASGVHNIILSVLDTNNRTATATTTLIIGPFASFTSGSIKHAAGQSINFDASASSAGPGRSIVSYAWNFGDNTNGTGISPSHLYGSIGTYVVSLTLTNDSNPPQTATTTVTILNEAENYPHAVISGSPYVIHVGDTLSLDGSQSWDPDTPYGDSIQSYKWDLHGNGNYVFFGRKPLITWLQLSTLLQTPKDYPADPISGFPTVQVDLMVTDSTLRTNTAMAALTIYNLSPVPTVTSISPSTGPTTGGTSGTINGTGFLGGATVTIGGNAAAGVTIASATSITCTTPAGTAGARNVVVTNPDNQTGTLAGGFTYMVTGSISGCVKNDNGTLPIANADVRIYDYNPLVTGQWVDCGGVKTDSNGNYTILSVNSGVYGVRAIASGYANEFFNGIYNPRQANPVSVTAPDNVSNIDFTLEIGGSFSGRVVSQSTGQPLANVSVDCGTDAIPPCWGATTDQNGNYIITSLPPGQYKVRSPIGWGSGDGNYVMKYYDDKTNWKEADLVTISTGSLDITGIKLSLESSNVNISVILQGGGRPDAGWAVPLTLKFFDNSTGVPGAILYTFVENTTKSGSTAVAIVGGIPSGTYDISVVSPHCLTNKKAGVVIATPSTAVNLGTLLEGDSNSTALSANTINIADFGILASAYGKNAGEDGYDAQADFDRNGIVNIADFGLLAANYGKSAPVEVH